MQQQQQLGKHQYPSFASPEGFNQQQQVGGGLNNSQQHSNYNSNNNNMQQYNQNYGQNPSNSNQGMRNSGHNYQPNVSSQNYKSGLDNNNKNYVKDMEIDTSSENFGENKSRKISVFSQYKAYGSNEIKSSKYRGMPIFIFQNIWFQMHKLANVYFLIIACLQCIPAISISQGQPVILLPLIVVISVSMMKDYFEDRKRKNADREENNRKIKVVQSSNGEIKDVLCQDLQVGHIVQIDRDQLIPADILVMEVSDFKKECYVETKNLDGETNLKIKEIPEAFRLNRNFMFEDNVSVDIDCIPPNKNLESFSSSLFVSQNGEKVTDFLESKHLLLRGCALKTTTWVKGIVLYTGTQTKIQLNSCESESKLSSLEIMMNKFIVVIFLIQVVVCFCSGIFGTLWMNEHKSSLTYLRYSSVTVGGFDFSDCFQTMGTWTLIFTNFIPISLIVTLEVVKYIQGINLESDTENYPECRVQSSNLNEELGQIKYIFSDKTGTLTQNLMKFKCLSVNGISFGEISVSQQQLEGGQYEDTQRFLQKPLENEYVDFSDSYFSKILIRGEQPMKDQIVKTLSLMALCHNVVPTGPVSYSGPSPDEICLVSFAQSQGVQFVKKDDDNILTIENSITHNGRKQQERYKLLHTFEFNSDRKRMSVIVQKVGSQGLLDEYLLLTKGADNIMEPRIASKSYDLQTQKNLNKYSEYGYRTLVLAQRQISKNELILFEQELTRAKLQMQNNRHLLDEAYNKMEMHLEYLAVTAVEDKLQVDVADVIQKIKEANINFWVLTGDKEETAISIGNAIKVIGDEDTTVKVQISKLIKDAQMINGLQSQQQQSMSQLLQQAIDEGTKIKDNVKKEKDSYKKVALIVKGDDLITITSDPQLKESFIKMSIECDTVIASRVSPSQKKEIVDMVRDYLPDVSTLAIGDGANDVSMITAAHVGVGIRGKEGTQAERSSNYAIPEFRFLGHLLFDFGRECYRRNSELVLYNFYKNMLLVLPQWWFGLYNGFSGVTLYDPWLYQLYNTCFTALPIVIYAIEDREQTLKEFLEFPLDYYKQGQTNKLFSLMTFLQSIFKGFMDSCVIMFVCFLCLENISITGGAGNNEHVPFFHMTGMVSFGVSILVSNLKILSFSHSVSVFQTICIFGSYIFYVLCYVLYLSSFKTADIATTFKMQYKSIYFYLINLVLLGATYLVDIACYVFINLKPQPKEIQAAQLTASQKRIQQHTSIEFSQTQRKQDNQFNSNQSYQQQQQQQPQQKYPNLQQAQSQYNSGNSQVRISYAHPQ